MPQHPCYVTFFLVKGLLDLHPLVLIFVVIPFGAMWLCLFGLLITGIVLTKRDNKSGRWIIFIVLALMSVIVFRPEWDDVLRTIRSHKIASLNAEKLTSPPPYHLTVFNAPLDESALLALAESGLFDITTSDQTNPTKFSKRVVVEASDKCMTHRTGFVRFIAATGFRRCGRLVSQPGILPPRHLVLWVDRAPLLQRSRWGDRQRAIQLSEQTEAGMRLLAYCETNSPLQRGLFDRLVIAFRRTMSDCRNPVTQDTYAMFHPDLVTFVLKGVGINPANIAIGDQAIGQ